MGPDDLPDNLSDNERAKSEDNIPLYLKGTPGERPDAHIYAAEELDGSNEG